MIPTIQTIPIMAEMRKAAETKAAEMEDSNKIGRINVEPNIGKVVT